MGTTEGKCELPTLAASFGYLDMLRESGVTNMFGAGAYLERDMGMTRNESRTVLQVWMSTFDPNKSPADRAALARARHPGETT